MSKKTIYLSILIYLIVLLQLSCSSNSTQPKPYNNSAVLPNYTGNTWVYAVYDSLNSTKDTITVQVAGVTHAPDNTLLMIWKYTSSSGDVSAYLPFSNDTSYVYSGQDTVYFFFDQKMHYINSKFAFPLEVGKEWSNNAVGISDTSEVTEKKQISTPVETFTNAFHIERNRNGLNDYISISYWFVNDVGFAKLYFKETGFSFRTFTWNLISYSVQQ